MDTLTFIISSLAVWRVSNLVSNESGPFWMFKHMRRRARILCLNNPFCRHFHLYELVTCEYCNSVWFGSLLTAFLWACGRVPLSLTIPYALALSTSTIIVKQVHEWLETNKGETKHD